MSTETNITPPETKNTSPATPASERPRPIAPGLTPLAVDINQAAEMLGVCDDTIRREIDRGNLRALKIGRVWRVRVSELDAYLRRCETNR